MQKLLMVDDEKELCDFMTQLLERRGYKVLIANCYKDALPIIRQENPEIILLDRRLPDGDGIDLLEEIRKFNTTIKVIMISAYDLDAKGQKRISSLDVLEYLRKPITISNIEKALKKTT